MICLTGKANSWTSFIPSPLFYRACHPKRVDDKVGSAESCKQDKGTHSSFGDGCGIHVDNLYVTG